MISINHSGNFNKTEKFFKSGLTSDYVRVLEKYAREGVIALASATPVKSGITANSWGYEINTHKGGATITWTNSNVKDGVPVVILLQYGHATRDGGYINGLDFINPAMRPIFEKIANDISREVANL
jgi:hypothetical protein